MKLSKKLVLCLLIFTTVTLFSCKNNNVEGPDPSDDENYVWGEGMAPGIVLDAYANENLDLEYWFSTLYKNCGVNPVLISDEAKAEKREITIGKVNRNISEEAYGELEKELESFGKDYDGWLIYSKGSSIAIAYDGPIAFINAIKHFNENYLTNKSFCASAKIVASNFFITDEYVDSLREAQRDKDLNALIPEIGEGAVEALKNMFSLYTDNLYKWMVDLYCPDVGGFYFSNAGRDTEGFLPDIESTVQILSFLSLSGLIREYGSVSAAVPEKIGNKMLYFAQSLQSSEDGYFYHPQWGTDIVTSRRGRDLGWATQLIQTFGGKPLYDTPNGVKGTLGAPEQTSSTSYLLGRLSTSSIEAVSKIVTVSKSSLPSYLHSLDEWAAYIDNLNIPYNSYHAGNTLAAQHGQIKLAGDEYVDYLINHLNDTQNPETALWEASDSTHDAYYAVNGLMKLASLYSNFEKTIPNPEAAVNSCVSVTLMPDGDTHVCSIYNPWITLNYILTSVERSEGPQKVSELRAIVLSKAEELIEATAKKISKYQMVDGGFAYYGYEGPCTFSQSALVSSATGPESDVNATCISSTGILANMFTVLGCNKVALYVPEDYIVFRERWLALGGIVKEPWADDVFPVTFDDFDSKDATIDGGVVIDPSEFVQNNIADLDTEGDRYKWFSSAVVEDPDPSHSGDLALRAETFLRPGESKDKAVLPSSTAFGMQGIVYNKNCFVFDSDIYFDRFENYTDVGQIHFMTAMSEGSTAVSLNVSKYTANGKTYLCIGENYQGLDGVKDDKVVSGIPTGEWVNLRIEVYKIGAEDDLDIKCKIYLNGKYKGTCDAGYVKNGKFADRNIASVNYSHYRYSQSLVYFDNVIAQAINKEYVQEDDYTGGPKLPEKIDFEDYMTYGDTTYLYPSSAVSPGASFGVESVLDSNGRVTLAFVFDSNKGGADKMRFQAGGTDADNKLKSANTFIFETDIKLDYPEGASGSSTTACEILLGSCDTGESYAYRACLYYYADTNEIKIEDIGIEGTGKLVSLGVGNNEWFTLRVAYYKISADEMLTLIFVNGNLKYASTNCRYSNSYGDNAWPVYDEAFINHKGKALKGVNSIFFLTNSNTDVTMCFDNSILRRIDSELPDIDINNNSPSIKPDESGKTPSVEAILGNLADGLWRK